LKRLRGSFAVTGKGAGLRCVSPGFTDYLPGTPDIPSLYLFAPESRAGASDRNPSAEVSRRSARDSFRHTKYLFSGKRGHRGFHKPFRKPRKTLRERLKL
jgi:hypothetical protein